MKLNKEEYSKEEVKDLLTRILNYTETKINTTAKNSGELGLININFVRKDINAIKEEVKNY